MHFLTYSITFEKDVFFLKKLIYFDLLFDLSAKIGLNCPGKYPFTNLYDNSIFEYGI
jgi:hypothetical protein